jgi:DMSO/TMAO reductase YedYZ molybdopterin-dependent catalytic subunit
MMLPFANGERPLVQYPQKRPLIQLTSRPPQLETPFGVFDESVFTPNDAFFVRYHLANLPFNLDPELFALEVSGHVNAPLRLSLADLRDFEPVELVAVCQCSGNSRGFFEPRVAGGQLGHGAMGNARWRGVPLRTVLDRAGIRPGARQVAFNGLDTPVGTGTPDFVKALDIDHARDGEVMLAYEMNGEALPVPNGFPLRLVVPGYYGTYWIKHLNQITVLDEPVDGFWMRVAYRIPDNPCACVQPGAAPPATVPINRLTIRSFITNLTDGTAVPANRPLPLKGIAFDSGYGISRVSVSTNGGTSWTDAVLGTDLGKYSFREWRLTTSLGAGSHELKVRATNHRGETQPETPSWNPAGYMRNVIETVRVTAA